MRAQRGPVEMEAAAAAADPSAQESLAGFIVSLSAGAGASLLAPALPPPC